MNSQQIENCISQFKYHLQNKIAKSVAIASLVFLCIFALLKIILLTKEIDARTKSEKSYLKLIGTEMVERERLEMETIQNFLDGSRKITDNFIFTSNNNTQCNSTYFACSYSTTTNYTVFNSIYPYIKANARSLAYDRGTTSIFMYNSNGTAYFNQTKVLLRETSFNTSIVELFISKNPTLSPSSPAYNNYVFSEAPISSTNFFQFFCEHLGTVSVTLCVLLNRGKIKHFSSNSQIHYFLSSAFEQINTGFSNPTIQDWALQSLNSNFVPPTILSCVKDNYKKLSQFINPQKGIFSICSQSSNQLLGVISSCLPFGYFQIRMNSIIASERYKSIYEQSKIIISYRFSSNLTYSQDVSKLIKKEINQIRYTGYSILAVLAVTFLFITIPAANIQSNIVNSIVLIRTLGEHLKNKEEKEFYNTKDKPPLFSFITDYFHKFMWIYKLLKFKSKSRYKKSLLEGIELFSKDYVPVQQYVFKQLIALQTNLIDKYQKLKELPLKKKSTNKVTIKLPLIENIHREQDKQKSINKRRFANWQLLDPDDDQLMKNISISFRRNHNVRFSNDIQTIEIDQGPVLRNPKSVQLSDRSCQTIKNDLSQQEISSLKHTENKDSLKSLKEEEESYTSLNQVSRGKKKDSLRSRGLESVHFDLNNIRLDESYEEEEEADTSKEEISEEEEMFQLDQFSITHETAETYKRIIGFYQQLIALKQKQVGKILNEDLLSIQMNALYELLLSKYKWLGQLLMFQNQNKLDINQEQRQKIAQFEDLFELEHNYVHLIKHEAVQKGEITKLLIHKHLQLPVPFKNLEYLAKNNQKEVRINARYLLAAMAEQLTPHLDEVLFNNIYLLLTNQTTKNTLKRQILAILIDTLSRYHFFFSEQIPQLKLVRQFYNTKYKKIYFLASLSNPKPFNKLLTKFHDLIHPFDIVCLFNLDQDNVQSIDQQISDTYLLKTQAKSRKSLIDKIKFQIDLEDFIDLFNFSDRIKQTHQKGINSGSNSTKTISKKKVYEKQFHQILNTIENDQTEFSKYIVVLLGQEHGNYSGEAEDSSSSGHRRPYQQKIHQEITKNLDRGYHHYILAGHQLSAYPSKYGRLKKISQISP